MMKEAVLNMEKAAEVLILTVALLPVLRVCFLRAFLLKLRAFPQVGVQLFGSFAAYVAVVTAAALYSPWTLRIATGIALLAIALNWWRARPSYGRARSLAIAPIGSWVDQDCYLKRAFRYGPVFKMNNFLQPMVCIAGLKGGSELLRSHDKNLLVPPIPGGFIRYLAPDEFTGLGLAGAFVGTRPSFEIGSLLVKSFVCVVLLAFIVPVSLGRNEQRAFLARFGATFGHG